MQLHPRRRRQQQVLAGVGLGRAATAAVDMAQMKALREATELMKDAIAAEKLFESDVCALFCCDVPRFASSGTSVCTGGIDADQCACVTPRARQGGDDKKLDAAVLLTRACEAMSAIIVDPDAAKKAKVCQRIAAPVSALVHADVYRADMKVQMEKHKGKLFKP